MTWQASPKQQGGGVVRVAEPRIRVPHQFGRQRAGDALTLQGDAAVSRPGDLELARDQPVAARGGRNAGRERLCQAARSPTWSPGISPITELSTNFTYRASADRAYGHNRSNNYNYRAVRVVRDRLPRLQGRRLLHEHLGLADHRAEQPRQLLVPQRRARVADAVGHADQLLREDRSSTSGSTSRIDGRFKRVTLNLGVRSDMLQHVRRAAVAGRRSVRAGPRLPRRLQRAELAGRVAAARRVLRPVRQRQDGASRPILAASRSPRASPRRASRRTRCRRRSTASSRTWTDLNGNFAPDCDLRDQLANAECGQMQNLNFGKSVPVDALCHRRVGRLRRPSLQLGRRDQPPARAHVRPVGQRVVQPALVRQLQRHPEPAGDRTAISRPIA